MAERMGDPKVAAVVVNWNGGHVFHQCIDSLVESLYPRLEVIVVDNGSTDKSINALKRRALSVVFIENDENLGYAMGANQGIQLALSRGADYIALLNNDSSVEPAAIGEWISVLEADPSIGIAGAKILRADDPTKLSCVWEEIRYNHVVTRSVGESEPDQGQYDVMRDVDCVGGAAMIIRRETFERIGVFDPQYFAYQEQVDFCERARRRGISILYVPQARVIHHGEHSLRSRNSLYIKTYLVRRNSVLFMKKHGNWHRWVYYLFLVALSLVGSGLKEIPRGRFAFFSARLRGYYDGFRGREIDGSGMLSVLK